MGTHFRHRFVLLVYALVLVLATPAEAANGIALISQRHAARGVVDDDVSSLPHPAVWLGDHIDDGRCLVRGDCDDYAIVKYIALLRAGLSRDDVKIAILHNFCQAKIMRCSRPA